MPNANKKKALSEMFKSEIERSISKSKVYSFNLGMEYELGFKAHSGMVQRVINQSLTSWLDKDLRRCFGKTCILNFERHGDKTICESELQDCTLIGYVVNSIGVYTNRGTIDDICLYIPGVLTVSEEMGGIDTIDVITCALPDYDSDSGFNDDTIQSLYNRLILTIHTAALNGVNTLIVGDMCDGMSGDDVAWIARTFKNVAELYKCYLSNVFYIVQDEERRTLFKSEIDSQ